MTHDFLSAWNNTATKRKIVEFVTSVTDPADPAYVSPSERIAVFDNDGTLSCEKPVSMNIMSALSVLAQRAEQQPELRGVHPYKAAWEQDVDWFVPYMTSEKFPELLVTLLESAAGETEAEFEVRATGWLPTCLHARYGVKYVELVYEPMVQLVRYLQANGFRVFVCSGSAMDFIRMFSESAFGIPRENVIGSNLALAWEYRSDGPVLVRQAGLVEPHNDRHGKPINIHLHIGRPPVIAVGNANGDIEMMEYCQAGGNPFLNVLLKHDDAEREYAYSHGADRIQSIAQERGWVTVSMKQDFATVFKLAL